MEISDLLSTIKISSKNLDIEDSLLWISNILPDVPSFVDDRKSQVVFNFQSSFVGSKLTVTLAKSPNGEGELVIQTDNYSVLTIMKDQITAQANQRNLQLSIESDFNDESVFHILGLLHPLVQE